MSLIKGMHEEMNRARELKKMYAEIPTGAFGMIAIQSTIDRAEKSIEEDNVVDMVKLYAELKELK